MNLAECIAALPRVERGFPRDIFAPLPTCPSPYPLELTHEYTRHINAPEDQGDASTSATAPRPPALRQQQQQPYVQSQTGGKAGGGAEAGSGGFNCAVCKKSFGSEATWNNHQLSAKHIAAVKDADKKKTNKTGSKGGSKSTSGHQKQQQQQEEEQDPPEVVEALASFRKVEKISGENPGMAAPVLWKIAKALWSHRRAQETTRVLSLLIQVLDNLQQAASMTGSTSTAGKAPATAGPGSLSPTQISMTLYLSQLAMARLTLFISPSIAQQYYLDAIQGRWQMDPADIQSICEMVSTGSAVQLLERCREYLATHPKTEKLMTPPETVATTASVVATTAPKKPTDPNLKLLTILLESASMLSQHHGQRSSTSTSQLTTDDRIRGEASIALYAMSAALIGASSGLGNSDSQSDSALTVTAILRNMATMYKHLNMLSSAAACLIRAGELELVTSKMRSDHQQGQLMWDLFQALLLSIDTADLVRMQRVIGLLEQCGVNNYLDVQTVVEVAQAVLYQDNDYLTHSAAYAIEHLLLLLHEGDADSKVHLLIYQNTTPAASIDTLIRVQQRVT
ncbi:hypothetical protein BGZ98_007788 [Dissophora globulifera]|nr:hypothetical protein BGZ98_007788 [Dissophora globulifera]